MNPDAEKILDEVFLAVHFDRELLMVDPGARGSGEQKWEDRQRWNVAPNDFLRDFLSPDRRQAYAAVRGNSGAGKSHFIRWLGLNIPQSNDTHVLPIPRAGINLRGVLEHIIAVLPAERAVEYRDALNATGYSSATRDQRCERLLSEIALAIGVLHTRPGRPDAEAEEWLIGELPALFNDPNYRAYISHPNGIIDQLVDHISEPSRGYERRENRREFQLDDLPLSGVGIADLSQKARAVLTILLSNQEYAPLAVDIINRSLNAAISGVLNFRGDKMLDLMLDVRRYLRAQGKSLILLIEDFASLQGIDTALLQALIEAPGDGPDGLCDMRWAMAVTTGYYEQLPDTVKTRVDFLIDMDLPLDARSVVSFATRYLNAVRLKKEELHAWYERGRASGSREPVPNHCDSCRFREECHASFGDAEGVGLYPFNTAALNTMATRKDPTIHDRFIPRTFIKMVLAEVMGRRREEIENGRFPDGRLLPYMGNSRLAPAVEEQLKHANPTDFERYRAILELWGEPGQLIPLPEGLYTAFALKPPILPQSSATASYQPVPSVAPSIAEPASQPREDTVVRAIQRWAQGEVMPENAAQELRDYIYAAVESYIDWDSAGLVRKSFMQRTGTGTPFRATSIVFARQVTNPMPSPVRLSIPLDPADADDLRRTASALTALRQFQVYKSWEFPDAFQGMLALGECLTNWSSTILADFKRQPGAEAGWDVVASAVEVLAVGAALSGKLTSGKTTDKLSALFASWPKQLPDQSSNEWIQLYSAIERRAEQLRDVVRAWASGTKGGQRGAMVDPQQLMPPLKRILRTWQLSEVFTGESDQLREPYQTVATLHAKVRADLPRVAASEYQRRMEWLRRVRNYMDEDTKCTHLIASAKQLSEAIGSAGIGMQRSVRNEFDEALNSLSPAQVDSAIRAAQQLQDNPDPVAVLPVLAPDRVVAAMVAADYFFTAADKLLAEAGDALNLRSNSLNARLGDQWQRDRERISDSLAKLSDALRVIGGAAC